MNNKLREMVKSVAVGILMTLVLCEFAYAKVSGNCANCHTMHNSQNATLMRLGSASNQNSGFDECLDCHAETRAVLLRMDCLGCHAQNPGGASSIIDNMPQVAHNASTDLAGGNYRYAFRTTVNKDSYGHNVHGFGNTLIGMDSNMGNNPPGYTDAYDPSTGKYQDNDTSQILCAGQNGCHGNREQVIQILAIRGTHHADDKILKFGADFTETGQGSTVGTSYRFLYRVHGGEDNDWQASLNANDHNEYKGDTFASRSQQNYTLGNSDCVTTISDLCAECHGNFHASAEIGTGSSPWLRHPTDVVLPGTGEYSAYTAYSTQAPVARVNILNSPSPTLTPGTNDAIVMCLSCHRAHASQYPDILRWDYSQMLAGDPSKSGGCFTCHTQKNVSP
jgi:predicted CXXCH cytochrome family protein